MRAAICLLLLTAPVALAQLDDDTITVFAIRPLNLQPDQVVISVSVQSPSTASLADVLDAIAASGISAADVTSAYTAPAYDPLTGERVQSTQWAFSPAVSFAQLKKVVASLESLQKNLQPGTGMSLNYVLVGTQVSLELQAANQCAYPTLVSDAQAQGQKLAAEAGGRLGPILALSDPGASSTGTPSRAGDFASSASAVSDPLLMSAPLATTCGMVVQFKLLR
jgi:uncharacterized protein YggE